MEYLSMKGQDQLLASLGVESDTKHEIPLDEKWLCYSLNHDRPTRDIPIILITQGPKNIEEVKKAVKGFTTCIIIFIPRNTLLLKAPNLSNTTVLENESEYERISNVLESCNIARASSEIAMQLAIVKAIDTIPNSTGYFENRGLFSTHYLLNRLFDQRNIDDDVKKIKQVIEKPPDRILEALGWKINSDNEIISIIITKQDDFSIKNKDSDITPSYTAISRLQKSRWVILTNGRKWRLYTSRVSAASTNYFEITLGSNDSVIQYLVAIFSASSYEEKNGHTDIDHIFDEGKNYATSLEQDLSSKIMSPNGAFLDIVKGVLDHDMKKTFSTEVLDDAKQIALKIMYRVWFLAYAESRNLLPTEDERYRPISLQSIHNYLDSYEEKPDGDECWKSLLKLFKGIREGSPEHNLPQYDGNLFKHMPTLDELTIKNEFLVNALRGLLESDGETVDYASLGVRHLGNIFESLMEFSVRQTDKDIFLLDDKNGPREVKTKQQSTYSYKKNDLYLASKGGIALRKTTASFYTPDKLVEFLVWRGLEPILAEREKLIGNDIQKWKNSNNDKDRYICMDRLLDIQVLDPAMGSGHFLVEALNRITTWATGILNAHPDHPLLHEIECDRKTVLSEQKKHGVKINESLLTYDVLLKRKIMKRCIFGVDLNPIAVELAKLSLWLDSFAIGMPLTYMDHHIKYGDSTIGAWLDDRKENVTDQTLDTWFDDAHRSGNVLHDVSVLSDVTIKELQSTKHRHTKYENDVKPYRKILDVLTAKLIDKDIAKNAPKDLSRIFEMESGHQISDYGSRYESLMKSVSALSEKLRFFHWELEMMDAFTDKRKGFDLIVTNPPWDKIRPNKNEFFGQFVVNYKQMSDEDKKILHEKYTDEFAEYKQTIDLKRTYYKNRGSIGENTDFEIYRLVLERILQLLSPQGILSVLIPSAIVGSRGAHAIRSHILEHKIISLYEFENKKKIFPIHPQTKFVLLTMQNTISSTQFPAAFYLHETNQLDIIDKNELTLTKEIIRSLSPNLLIICELKDKQDLDIFLRLFQNHFRLENMDGWSVDLGRELNLGEEKDKKLLVKNKHVKNSWPVLESKNFHQHIWNFAVPTYYADMKKTLKHTHSKRKFQGLTIDIHENPRLVYRGISAATNTRTMIASIIPHSVFTTLGAFMAIPRIGTLSINANYHTLNAYLCGIFNSMTFDYMLRPKIDKNVETYHIFDTIIPKDFTGKIASKIIELTAKLFLATSWHDDMAISLAISKNDVKNITMQKHIEILAEIDALVAIHYGLEKNEYEHVMQSFRFDDKGIMPAILAPNASISNFESGDRNKIMKQIFGHVRKLALEKYDNIVDVYKKPMRKQS